MEPHDLALEYAGEASPSAAGTVLLVAVPRKRLDFVAALAEAAGLTVEAVTLSSIALAEATGRLTQGEGAILHVTSGTAELAVQHRGHPRVLRHMRAPVGAAVGAGPSVAGPPDAGATDAGMTDAAANAAPLQPAPAASAQRDPAAALTLELRQVLSLMPQNGTIGSGELVLWDGVGLGDAPRIWSDAIGLPVRERSLDALGVTLAPNGTAGASAGAPAGAGRFAPAAALGLLALGGGRITPDLLNSRLVEKKKSRAGKPLVWGIVVGSVLLFAIAFAAYDLTSQRREVESLKGQLVELQPSLKTADATIARVSFAQRWQDQDPKFLACLRHLTDVFPDDAQLWATRVNLKDDGTGSMEFQAANDQVATAAIRRIQQSPYFKDVKVITTGQAGRNSRGEQSSTVTFRFTGAPPPAPPSSGGGAGGGMNTGGRAALDKAGTPAPSAAFATTTPTTGPAVGAAATTAPNADDTNRDTNGRRRRRGNR
jgi:hypothetical protein